MKYIFIWYNYIMYGKIQYINNLSTASNYLFYVRMIVIKVMWNENKLQY